MNASNRFWMVIVFFALLFALGGCKAAATETLVAENTAICPLMNLKASEGIKGLDPELGECERMVITEWEFTCSDPYFKGKNIEIQDFYYHDDGTVYWTGFYEGVTDEGGVWKGTCENNMDGKMKSVCTLVGESKYKGLLLSLEYGIETGYVEYRITKEPEE